MSGTILLLFLAGPALERGPGHEPIGPAADVQAEAILPDPAVAPGSGAEAAGAPAPDEPAPPAAAPGARAPGWWREERAGGADAPGLAWAAFSTLVVLALLCGALWLMKRLMRRCRFFSPGRVLEVLARLPLDRTSALYLVRVGRRVVLVGSTRDRLTPLSEVADPDEAAALRAEAGAAGGDSESGQFRERLREGLADYERAESTSEPGPLERIEVEVARIREAVQSWRP
jgi:flagellar biosynthetic protein FliO